jgi:phospholipase/carboxylesterase
MSLTSLVRRSEGDPQGALVLLHGRGADENDLSPLLDMLDPDRRLIGTCPRGPLNLPPGGAHWYRVMQVGYPEAATFHPTYSRAQEWLDAWLVEVGLTIDRTVLGGFSQGCVMSYALALGAGRPRPAGLIGMSGFIPTVDDLSLDLVGLSGWPAMIGHGSLDPVIEVGWGRKAHDLLREADADVVYRESPLAHGIDPSFLSEAQGWLQKVLP